MAMASSSAVSGAALSFSPGSTSATSKAFSTSRVALLTQLRRQRSLVMPLAVARKQQVFWSRLRAVDDEEAASTPEESDVSAAAAGESIDESPSVDASTAENAGEVQVAGGDEEQEKVPEEVEAPPKPRMVYPKGLSAYETMAVLRPNITEEQRLALSQRYEEAIIASGGMDVEVFNRGILPLAYSITKKNTRGEKNVYLDGIYYLFTYATKPSSQKGLQKRFEKDDDVIRFMTLNQSNLKEIRI